MKIKKLYLRILADYADALLQLSLELGEVKRQKERLEQATNAMPTGWGVTKITDTKIRVDALTESGVMCHWVLDALEGESHD